LGETRTHRSHRVSLKRLREEDVIINAIVQEKNKKRKVKIAAKNITKNSSVVSDPVIKNCVRTPLMNRQLYENALLPMLHLRLGMGKITEDIAVKDCRTADFEQRIRLPHDKLSSVELAILTQWEKSKETIAS